LKPSTSYRLPPFSVIVVFVLLVIMGAGLMPLLFTKDLGSELQKPLALAVIGGMTLGTVMSLFLVPLAYYYLKKS
jgi:Cu/Ag efflux pump CusA